MYKNHLLPHKTQWEGAFIWKNMWWTSTCIYFSTCLTPTVSAQSNWCLFTPPTPSLHPRDQQQHAPSPIKAAQGWTREGRVKSDFNRKKLAEVCSVRLFWLTAVYCHYTLTGSCVRWLPENWCSDWQICRTTVHCTYTLNDSSLSWLYAVLTLTVFAATCWYADVDWQLSSSERAEQVILLQSNRYLEMTSSDIPVSLFPRDDMIHWVKIFHSFPSAAALFTGKSLKLNQFLCCIWRSWVFHHLWE